MTCTCFTIGLFHVYSVCMLYIIMQVEEITQMAAAATIRLRLHNQK